MEGDNKHLNWYAVYCKAREETRATAHLENQGMQVLYPRIRNRRRVRGNYQTRVEPMFPRYVFVGLGADDNPGVIRSTRGAIGLVRFGEVTPSVPEALIDHIRGRADEYDIIDLSATAEFKPDDPVEVVEGPFAGLQAIFRERTGDGRVAVLLNLMAQQRRVEMKETSIVRRKG